MNTSAHASGLKDSLSGLLKRMGLYERTRASWIYDFYWRAADGRIIADREKEIDFYKRTLEGFRSGNVIFDVGANQGYKAQIFLKLGARVIAVEPDETCQEILRQKFLKYRFKSKPLEIVNQALGERNSIETMWIDTPGGAKNTLSQKWADSLKEDEKRFGEKLNFGRMKQVATTTLDELIAVHGVPYFIKIDVEGYELTVLRGLRRPVPYLSFEVNLPQFRCEGQDCVRLLWDLSRTGEFNYAFDCRSGMALRQWTTKDEILRVLESCEHSSIEVFWKNSN